MHPALRVAGLSTKVWRRTLARTLSVGERSVVLFFVVLLAVTAALGLVLYLLISEFLSQTNPAAFTGDPRVLLRLVFSGSALGSLVFVLVLCVSLPERTALDLALRLVPVSRGARTFGATLPLLILGFVFASFLGLPSLAVVFEVATRGQFSLGAVVAFIWLIAWTTLTWTYTFFVLRRVIRRGLPFLGGYASGIAVTLTFGLGLLLAGIDIIPVRHIGAEAWWAPLSPTRALANALLGYAGSVPSAWGALVGWSVVAVGLAILDSRMRDQSDERASNRLFVGLGLPSSRFGARVWLELVQLVRLPQFIVLLFATLVTSILIPVAYGNPNLAAVADQFATVGVVIPAAIGVHSFGATRRAHWVALLATGRPLGWVVPKLLIGVIVPLVAVIPYFTALLAVGFPPARMVDVLSIGCVMVACASLVGLVVPSVPNESIASTITIVTTTVLWAIVSTGSRLLAAKLGLDQVAATYVAAAVVEAAIPLALLRARTPQLVSTAE